MRFLRLATYLLLLSACSALAGSGMGPGPGLGTAFMAAPLGVNASPINYFASNLPFLNLMKAAGGNNHFTGWSTQNGSETSEEPYLQLDSNGYATSLTASPTPSGGQKFTYIETLLSYNVCNGLSALPPGSSTCTQPGTYRVKFEGQGTVKLAGNFTYNASNDTCPSNLTITNSASNTFVSCTVDVTDTGAGSGGPILEVTAITSNTDYPRAMSVVLNSQASNYDAGAIFNPAYLALLANFSSIRFMDWGLSNDELFWYSVSGGSISSGATSATLSSAWGQASGTYAVVFTDGEQRQVTFTVGQTTMSWSGGLTNTVTNSFGNETYSGELAVDWFPTFAQRALPSNAFWNLYGGAGMPLEVMVALVNQLTANNGFPVNAFFDIPMLYDDADIESYAQAVMSGTGFQSGYSGLGSTQNAIFELSNEVWNYDYAQTTVATSLGGFLWPNQMPGGSNAQWLIQWYGMRTAQMSSDIQSALGTSLFTRAIPVLGAQASSGTAYDATYALQCSYWSGSPCSGYSIKAVAIAPYWGGSPSSGDCTTMVGVSNPLNDFFATLTSQTGPSGNTYSSVPSGGWLGQAEGWISEYVSVLHSSYPSLALIAYEGGQNFLPSNGVCSGWASLVMSAERDARMGTAYTNYLNYWKTNVGAGQTNVNTLYNDVEAINSSGAWGLAESVMQTLNSTNTPKWAAVQLYMVP